MAGGWWLVAGGWWLVMVGRQWTVGGVATVEVGRAGSGRVGGGGCSVRRVCVSTDDAEFDGTILYAGRCGHRLHGRVEVLGYQNRAVNLAAGPNAMVLHVPAVGVTRENFLSAGRDGEVLTRMVEAVRSHVVPVDSPMSMDWTDGGVEVFAHDIYTVVLASDPTRIPQALEQVPPNRRPRVAAELFRFYGDVFPGHTIVLCCFEVVPLNRTP
ncbi:hypothetical protein ACIQMJ_27670 [Actinosynnema sp. NPDC091369]